MEVLDLEQTELFISGAGNYQTYRIPALVVTVAGTILAFCEGRRDSSSDSGQIDLLLRRSSDGGSAWSEPQIIATEPDVTCGNPCPVVDQHTGTIWLPFCRNFADGPEGLITEGKAPRTVWLTSSQDDGLTWAEPREITSTTKDPSWTWYATGPTHGIQLTSGRLVIPCDHMVGVHFDRQKDPYHSHVIISDDGGVNWRIGGIVDEGTNECAIIETADGSLYINCRNYRGEKRRASARSVDGGDSFAQRLWEDDLPEPICQGSLLSLPAIAGAPVDAQPSDRALFANPASSTARRDLTLRSSEDGGRSWTVLRSLYAGPAAYSDLAVTADGATVLCLYERGAESPYETLTLARLSLA